MNSTTGIYPTELPSVSTEEAPPARDGVFPPTRWSLIRRMQDGNESVRRESLETICAVYWKPAYTWLRARGASPGDAEDVTQDFFSRLIAGDWLAEVNEAKGRLRSFMLVLLKRQASNDYDHRQAKKRGGGCIMVPIDTAAGEAAWRSLPPDGASLDVIFDRQWALQLLDRVMEGLRDTCAKAGKADLFDELRDYLSGGSQEDSYGESAARLGVSANTVKSAAFRLRERYRERLRAEVLDTLGSPEGVEEEIGWLLRVFA